MTDEDERIINRAISLLSNAFQDEREEARAALHRIFRKIRALELRLEAWEHRPFVEYADGRVERLDPVDDEELGGEG